MGLQHPEHQFKSGWRLLKPNLFYKLGFLVYRQCGDVSYIIKRDYTEYKKDKIDNIKER